MSSLLILDSNKHRQASVVNYLTQYNYECFTASDLDTAIGILQDKTVNFLMIEIGHDTAKNKQSIADLSERFTDLKIIVTCERIHALDAVELIRSGVDEILLQPLDLAKLVSITEKDRDSSIELAGRTNIESAPERTFTLDDLAFKSDLMFEIVRSVRQIADSDIRIIVAGPIGSGKGVMVEAIHRESRRRNNPLIGINCSAIPANLIESELYGYEKGAFTDATQMKNGLLELANFGTMLLDEIGDMPFEMQAKLLKVIEEKQFYRIGGRSLVNVDVRYITTSNQDLREKIARGEFREDLYFRLAGAVITLPSLSERREDIIPLARQFIDEFNVRHKKNVQHISPEIIRILMKYPWYGNIRELRNLIECMIVNAGTDTLTTDDLPSRLVESTKYISKPVELVSLREIERRHIINMLNLYDGNRKKVADALGIARSTLFEKIKQYGIPDEDNKS
jgi:DNA-binding NtrC family response regulator